MIQVSDLMNDKGRDIWSVPPNATVYEAIDQMSQKRVGALLILDGEQLVGIVSERDYARKVILKGKSPRETLVSEIMSHPVICARPEYSVHQAMTVMTEKHIRHLPVMVGERLVAVISMRDVVRGIIAERELEVQQLTDYITSG